MSTLTVPPQAIPAVRSSAEDRLNYLNIGLILLSALLAMAAPFEVFLAAYAVLGPLHYLTEISWLQRRNFYAKSKYDWIWLSVPAVVIAAFALLGVKPEPMELKSALTAFGLGAALVFALVAEPGKRIACLLVVAAVAVAASQIGVLLVLFATFIPSLVHVYVFTGLFMLYGSLKSRSLSGYLSVVAFIGCPLLFLVINPAAHQPSQYVLESYWKNFASLNIAALGIGLPGSQDEMDRSIVVVFGSRMGLMFMRFVAFAYLYHYLNWFSKTSIIQWHQVSKPRLNLILGAWVAAVGLYAWDYRLGVQVLALLSLMHVFLEFPLNHISWLGIWRELPKAIRGH